MQRRGKASLAPGWLGPGAEIRCCCKPVLVVTLNIWSNTHEYALLGALCSGAAGGHRWAQQQQCCSDNLPTAAAHCSLCHLGFESVPAAGSVGVQHYTAALQLEE